MFSTFVFRRRFKMFAGLVCLIVVVSLTGCVEEKVTPGTSWGSDSSSFRPTRTQFEKPPEPESPGIDWLYPFEAIGDGLSWTWHGIASLWQSEPDKSSKSNSFTMTTPDGRNVTVPNDYSGTREYQGKDGQSYKLHFDNGRMTGIDRSGDSK